MPPKTKLPTIGTDQPVTNPQTSYDPKGEEKVVQTFLSKRVPRLKEVRRKKLPGLDRSAEDIWADIDREFTPHELGLPGQRKRIETDETTGLRGKLVKIGDEGQWQADNADPVFYVKVTTALSILIEQNPEAVFMPSASRFEKSTEVAYATWKNSWENSNAKQQVKLFTFNLAKYGTAYGKTYPKTVVLDKTIQTEYYPDDQSKNQYQQKRIVKYNDICRRNLNPWRVWMSESTRPGDSLSTDDWYHEEDYSVEKFQSEFQDYPNAKLIQGGAFQLNDKHEGTMAEKDTEDIVTVGFYENQVKDKYAIYVPARNIVLYHSPLPNDDGLLSVWTAPWSLRHDESHIGIGIYEIIRQDAASYDRMKNMTQDQLTLAIYKMFFHKGLDQLGQNGRLKVAPGVGEQVADPKGIQFLEVPGPGAEAWKGLQFFQDKVDSNSGVPQQLSGKFTGNTLGQDSQAKEVALQRMKAPLDFILDALQREAYLSLSWLKQILSIPEVLEWTDLETLQAGLKELGVSDDDITKYTQEAQNPITNGTLLYQGQETGKKYANVFREISLNLEQDKNNELIPSDNSRFYRIGMHIAMTHLDWQGTIRIKPQSVLAPSKDLEKRNDLDLYNLVFPSIEKMAINPLMVPALMPSIKQIVKIFDKKVEEWMDVSYFQKLYQDASAPKPPPAPELKTSISIAYKDIIGQPDDVQSQILEKFAGIKVEQPLFVDKASGAPIPGSGGAQPVDQNNGQPTQEPAPNGQYAVPKAPGASGPNLSPVADMHQAPSSLGAAVQGANAELG